MLEWLMGLLDFGSLVSVPEMLLRVFLACLCGGVIGIERNRRQKDAGTRTHLVVALGAALFMIVSKYGFFDIIGTGMNADATRIASTIVTGVSFLGAGVIFTKGTSIKGLTTSAGIWATAAVGCALGAGMYLVGITVTVLLLLFQVFLHKFYHKIEVANNEITVSATNESGDFDEVSRLLSDNEIHIESIKLRKNPDGTRSCTMTARRTDDLSIADLSEIMNNNSDITAVDMKNF